jgi:hypothetical protein
MGYPTNLFTSPDLQIVQKFSARLAQSPGISESRATSFNDEYFKEGGPSASDVLLLALHTRKLRAAQGTEECRTRGSPP